MVKYAYAQYTIDHNWCKITDSEKQNSVVKSYHGPKEHTLSGNTPQEPVIDDEEVLLRF